MCSSDLENRFNIPVLTQRLSGVVRWAADLPKFSEGSIGLFGASTGAAAALYAAAENKEIRAVVSRGGRPDLALDALAQVACPTLLIVGGADTEVLKLNQLALSRLGCEKQLAVVPHATHLFEEPGALIQVARLAANWFKRHLPAN